MMRFFILLFFITMPVFADDVLRGQVAEEIEPVYALHLGVASPAKIEDVQKWALETAADAFAGMIYGWEFEYEPGERARGISENLELKPRGQVDSGDVRLTVTDASVEDNVLYIWSDYSLSGDQKSRVDAWKSNISIGVNATGYSPLHGPSGTTERKMIKIAALHDAARSAIRAYLRAYIKNRPRITKGYISLSSFPIYKMFSGQWSATARFRLEVTEVVPFAVY
jgi:hypothetical protein